MTEIRKKHSAQFKAKVAVQAIKEQKTINELTREFGVHATQINNWKKQALEGIKNTFENKPKGKKEETQSVDELYQTIGKMLIEIDWLKKKLTP